MQQVEGAFSQMPAAEGFAQLPVRCRCVLLAAPAGGCSFPTPHRPKGPLRLSRHKETESGTLRARLKPAPTSRIFNDPQTLTTRGILINKPSSSSQGREGRKAAALPPATPRRCSRPEGGCPGLCGGGELPERRQHRAMSPVPPPSAP